MLQVGFYDLRSQVFQSTHYEIKGGVPRIVKAGSDTIGGPVHPIDLDARYISRSSTSTQHFLANAYHRAKNQASRFTPLYKGCQYDDVVVEEGGGSGCWYELAKGY